VSRGGGQPPAAQRSVPNPSRADRCHGERMPVELPPCYRSLPVDFAARGAADSTGGGTAPCSVTR
jgi:hypothetical protein